MRLGEPIAGRMTEIIDGLLGGVHCADLGRTDGILVALVGGNPAVGDVGCNLLDIVLFAHVKHLL